MFSLNPARFLKLILCVLFSGVLVADEATMYVTDVLWLNLISAPAEHQFEILGVIKSGQSVMLLGDEQNGYVQVKLPNNSTGWVKKRYLVSETTAQQQQSQAQAQGNVQILKTTVTHLEEQLIQAHATLKNQETKIKTLQSALNNYQQQDTLDPQIIDSRVQLSSSQFLISFSGIFAFIGAAFYWVFRFKRKRRYSKEWIG